LVTFLVGEISRFWSALPEGRKAALFSLILWLILGLILRIWED